MVVAFGVLALVAVPATVTALFALASFRYSEPPEPSVGALWAGITLLLLLVPVAAGLLTSRTPSPLESVRPSRRRLVPALAAAALIAGWLVLRRVV